MRTLLYSLTGFLVATAVIWAGLFALAVLFLLAGDSYWDRNAGAADIFFACWIIVAIGAAIVMAKVSQKAKP